MLKGEARLLTMSLGQAIEENLEKRNQIIKRMNHVLTLDKDYIEFLEKFKNNEIIPDIIIWGYEEFLKQNHHLQEKYPKIAQQLWVIGCSGQGDKWFLDQEEIPTVLFYDHNQGEYQSIDQFLSLNINFKDFLTMAFHYQALEQELDKNENLSKDEQEKFKQTMSTISKDLYALYPFKYF